MQDATGKTGPPQANRPDRAPAPPCPTPPRISEAQIGQWANTLRAERQNRHLAERTGLERAQHRARLHKDKEFDAFYGTTRRETQAELAAIRERQARSGPGALLYRMGAQARADEARAQALDKSLDTLTWRETEAREGLRAAQAKETQALLARQGQARAYDERQIATAYARGRVPEVGNDNGRGQDRGVVWQDSRRAGDRAQEARTSASDERQEARASANDVGRPGRGAGPEREPG